jgi:polysaccharide biosynthesis protein PslH
MKKKILIINPISLFPKVMAIQDRLYQMIIRLSQDHDVDVATHVINDEQRKLSEEKLRPYCREFYPIKPINYGRNKLRKKIIGLIFLVNYYIFGISRRVFYWAHKKSRKQILNIINKNDYDIVQITGWYQCILFKYLNDSIIKIIDTNDILFEKKEVTYTHKYNNKIPFFKKRELEKYKMMEIEILNYADQLISISQYDYNRLNELAPNTKSVLIPTGQSIEYFQNYIRNKEPEDAILFYGGMNSEQNITAFWRFWNYIYPNVKAKISNVKLFVVGSYPPKEIKDLHNDDNIIVTGFVEDVRTYFEKVKVLVIPLEIAGGFRSRVIDVMAMGIPVVGTHNALDSIEMVNGVHGFIDDNDNVMCNRIIKILSDKELYDNLSTNCIDFVSQKYSIDTTYGKLSKYYLQEI